MIPAPHVAEPQARPASLTVVRDRRGDSRSGVPGNDIVRATASFSSGRFRFTVTNVRIPQGLFPPTIEILRHALVGDGGGPYLQTNTGKRKRIHRHFSGNTVVYSFSRKLLGRIDERAISWRAAIMEGRASDLAPNRGYAKLKVR